jgi:DNA primase
MDAVEEVKARLSIEDVISEYVPLKRAGRNWRGLSPWTNEKTPSLMVSPEKQIWHDFSSGKGGNMFSFVMEVEGLDFKAALELLARKAGIDIEQYRSSGPRSGGPSKERLYDLLEHAATFYQAHFRKHQTAKDYVLEKRKFTKETAKEWKIGYSPASGSALIDYAKKQGYTDAEIKQAGLSAQNYRGGTQDMFRGRLMIPLQDPQGRLIGFTARLLEDDPNAPKYINTPQTVLYDKSRHIYGMHLAKESIRKSKFVVMVEGNLDVIASHQAGVRQVVATAGTALTESHLKALSRFTGDIRLAFDADKAGVAATERAIPIASKVKVSLSMIDIPSGKDPDDLIRKDPKLWEAAITKHQYALDWLMARYRKELDLDSAQGKRGFTDILLPVVRSLSDDVERDHYLGAIAKATDTSRDALEMKFQKTTADAPQARRRAIKTNDVPDRRAVENKKVQDNFLSLMLMRPTLRELMRLVTPEMLYGDEPRALLDFLNKHPASSDLKELKRSDHWKMLGDYVKIQSLLYEELYQGLELNELHDEAARLQVKLVDNFVKTEKTRLARELDAADSKTQRELLGRSKKYDELLNQVKGAAHGQSQAEKEHQAQER